MKFSVTVTLKKDVLDPQGKVVSQTLKNMGYKNIISVRQGKYFEIELSETDKEKAKKIVEEISKKLLTNIVIKMMNWEILLLQKNIYLNLNGLLKKNWK